MADSTTTDTAPSNSGSGSKIAQFVRKNKTLSIVLGAAGIFALYKSSKNGGSSEEGEAAEVGPAANPMVPNAFLTPSNQESGAERISESEGFQREQIARQEEAKIEAEREERERKREREELERENATNNPGDSEPGESPEPKESVAQPHRDRGVSIHGREFKGATGSRIVKSGQVGGKPYVEYAIQYPGKLEHWRYFTDTGHWRQAGDTSSGPGANKPKHDSPKHGTPKHTGSKPPNHTQKAAVGRAHPVKSDHKKKKRH